MIRALIIEDEPLAASLLSSYAEKIEGLEIVGTFYNPLKALPTIKENKADLIFLDIQMPELRGTELAKLIPPSVEVIFTTAYPEYAVQGFELKALDYLVKPISLIRFLESINRYRERHKSFDNPKSETQEFIFIKSEYKLQKLNISDILYFQGNGDYCNVICIDKKILTLEKLSSFEKRLSSNQFIRIHRSYIVSKCKIESIEKRKIKIGGKLIPIGLTYEKHVRSTFLA